MYRRTLGKLYKNYNIEKIVIGEKYGFYKRYIYK